MLDIEFHLLAVRVAWLGAEARGLDFMQAMFKPALDNQWFFKCREESWE